MVGALIRHIVDIHHEYLRRELPGLDEGVHRLDSEPVSARPEIWRSASGLFVFLGHHAKVCHGTELRHPWRPAVSSRAFEFRDSGKQKRFFLLHLKLGGAPELVDHAMQGGEERTVLMPFRMAPRGSRRRLSDSGL